MKAVGTESKYALLLLSHDLLTIDDIDTIRQTIK